MSSIFVTSHLVLGDVPTGVTGVVISATSAAEAVKIIKHGGTAVLPADAESEAEEVLRTFGADEAHIHFMMRGKFDAPA